MDAGEQRSLVEQATGICVEEDPLRPCLTGDAPLQDRRRLPRVDDPDPPTNAEYQNF
jgi:hypothetical protein